jgi:hypothetical protein
MRLLSGPVFQEVWMRTGGRIAVRMSTMQRHKEAWLELVGTPAEDHDLDGVLETLEVADERDDERYVCQSEAEEIIGPILERVYIRDDTTVSVLADTYPHVQAAQECVLVEGWRAAVG